ncbi:Activator of Hsp90 ATPase 1 family protein [Beutenbergia cavernae DSM 12333]|uniref:Activator of Hsp90 ATPase 1 family protein n=1 Tax=Beutenbergia cavernae (strain ATCC BAA-8 / DSM 12333 / CCUG 43141 / JCM 11478 / NBRC 16432 / NCIMB 13614 / HKI 0122) TaxID=471853 RepID=C5BZ12_BEUC1|nr:SRPBCC domain-containing protein [Beutenbergia cavernae]ACQ81127.1 Activator of Hsp90 ATPase 1 family protein [Beutenbergia cavernae DSM 12333]
MTVISTTPDTSALTLTIVAEFAAPPERVWEIWSDPRQLERWWGPPTWPATFTEHDLSSGGAAKYHMTGPDGEESHGWWRFLAVDSPRSIEYEDGFADADGTPTDTMPTVRGRVTLEPTDAGTRMTVTSSFDTAEQMQQLTEMGMVEGMQEAMGQIDGILAGA